MKHRVDVHVGQRIRYRRWMIGFTQKQLADSVGIKFQQIQKYETGANRVSASRLFEISKAMDVAISYFFDELSNSDDAREPIVAADPEASEDGPVSVDLFYGKEALELIRCFYGWPEEQRTRLLDLTRSICRVA